MKGADVGKEDLVFKLCVRVYGLKQHSKDSHGYLIGDMPTGVSHVIGVLHINIRVITPQQLRPMLEFDRSSHMDKRSILFQEAIFIMDRLPVHSQNPPAHRYDYRLGFVKKDKSELRLIVPEDESKPISELIGAVDFFEFDLAIVPLTQIVS